MNKEINEKWVAIDGSIFTEKQYTTKHEWGTKTTQPKAIAYNVGKEIAEYIVRIHNAHQHPVHKAPIRGEFEHFRAAPLTFPGPYDDHSVQGPG